jgi:dihydrofolate reductase
MRKLLYGAAMSLDGFIARPDGGVDWLHWSDDVAAITATYWSTIDTVLMGRKTYDVAVASGSSRFPGKQTYVYSRSLEARAEEGLEIVGTDAVEHVRALKHGGGEGICLMGGGELARPLFEAGLIDEVGVNLHPVLLGDGIPMFHRMTRQIDLTLVEFRALRHECTYVLYAVTRG